MGNEEEIKHPATVRVNRVRPDGSIKPFSIDEQWKQVADWHAFLGHDKASDYPVLNGLNEAWDEIEPLYRYGEKSIMERGAELKAVSSSPLSALFYMVDMGFYPPPELLLALHDCWDTYDSSGGQITLEQAFLGAPVQKAGNYAARHRKRLLRLTMRMNFDRLLHEGMTRQQAAEAVSDAVGGKPEPESILRMFRGPMKLPKVTAGK